MKRYELTLQNDCKFYFDTLVSLSDFLFDIVSESGLECVKILDRKYNLNIISKKDSVLNALVFYYA